MNLKRMHDAMGDELEEIVDIYLTQMSENLAKLTVAIANGNANAVNQIAHNCVGTSANCGVVALLEPLRELELAARKGNLIDAPRVLAQAKQEFVRLQDFLKENANQLAF